MSESKWSAIDMAPADPILGLNGKFRDDTSDKKVNLGVGAFRTDDGKPYLLPVVHEAEKRIVDKKMNKEYLPIDGDAVFQKLSAKLILGDDAPIDEGKIVSVQAFSGTGSLRVGLEFLARFNRCKAVYLSNPTWPNHRNIIRDCGMEAREYRYFDPKTISVDFDGFLADLRAMPDHSVVVLHVCAHNPTGLDLNEDQWNTVVELFKERPSLVPFFDSAYQGFASGDLKRDSFSVRLFVKNDIELFCSQSFAKNLGLYGERIGALHMLVKSKDAVTRVRSQLLKIVRPMYSNPALHGARIVNEVLSDPELFKQWQASLDYMSQRISNMRKLLFDALVKNGAGGDWSHITRQIGMFSYTGLEKAAVDIMQKEYHIYFTDDGRISMCGVTADNVEYIAAAIKDAVARVRGQ